MRDEDVSIARQIARWIFLVLMLVIIAVSGGGISFVAKPLGAAYLALWVIWVGSTLILRKQGKPSKYDKVQYIALMTLGILSLFVLLVGPPWEYSHFKGPIPRDGVTSWIGIGFFAAGVVISIWAMWELKGFFTVRLGIQKGQRVVKSGPYRFIRHPGYFGFLLCFLGIGLAMSSIIALVALVFIAVFIFWRMNVEEKMLLEQFDGEYRIYMRKTKRLVPFIY